MTSTTAGSKGLDFVPVYNDPGNYKAKYPEDNLGEEMNENARIWKVYNDEAREYDKDMVQGWGGMIDILLVFAGLFSAAVTTFVAQASTSLEPDYSKVSAILLAELVNERRTGGPNVPIQLPDSIESLSVDLNRFVPSLIDHWTCGLWFMSLTLSLATSLGCVIVKQWLSSYLSPISASPRTVAIIRHFRFMGLSSWQVPFIIGLLPQALALSLFLFLAGLVTFLFPRSQAIAIAVIMATLVSFSLYITSTILPTFIPNCPYRTPLTQALRYFTVSFMRLRYVFPIVRKLRPLHYPLTKDILSLERKISQRGLIPIGLQGLDWLYKTSQSDVIKELVVECLSAPMSLPRIGFKTKLDNADEWTSTIHKMLKTPQTNWDVPHLWFSAISYFKRAKSISWSNIDISTTHRYVRLCRLLFQPFDEQAHALSPDQTGKAILEEVEEHLGPLVEDRPPTKMDYAGEQKLDVPCMDLPPSLPTEREEIGDVLPITETSAVQGAQTSRDSGLGDETKGPALMMTLMDRIVGISSDQRPSSWDEENQRPH